MALRIPLGRSSGAFAACAASWRQTTTTTPSISRACNLSQRLAATPKLTTTTTTIRSFRTSSARNRRSDDSIKSGSDQPGPTDLGALDVLGNTPVPSTSVDICMWSGFQLNNGTRVTDGSGVLLVGGEAFSWRPWEANNPQDGNKGEGAWDVEASTLNLLSVLWPRPDLLVLGLGHEMRPISPALRQAISALGMRVEVLDTRNAAAQFNLLATERGVDDVAAALIPIGWREGVGAGEGDEPEATHE
ncbi:uncharacterized protein PG998_006237 [Apiospora kogelbergensis]|uniref:uncharacterized protein n=1 Tax=Apiospora kogelbergensis TaxID=1337665 RepID=UPI00312D4263